MSSVSMSTSYHGNEYQTICTLRYSLQTHLKHVNFNAKQKTVLECPSTMASLQDKVRRAQNDQRDTVTRRN